MGNDKEISKLRVDGKSAPESRIMTFDDDKSESLLIVEGDFKKIKNYDPADFMGESLGDFDEIIVGVKAGQTAHWFKDPQSSNTYAFITDKNDKIIAGAIVEYSGSQSETGIFTNRTPDLLDSVKTNMTLAPTSFFGKATEYKGDFNDKEEIKAYLKEKIKDNANGLEVTKYVSKDEMLDAASGLASSGTKTGTSYKSSGGETDKGSNSIA